jgi:hypothetical protein
LVSLDPVTGADRDQRRRDHVAPDPELGQQPQQIKPARSGLVADRQTLRAAESIDEPPDRCSRGLELLHLRQAAPRDGSVAATIESFCTSRATHRRTSAG